MSLSPAHGLLSHKANDLLGLVQAYGTDDTVTENRIGLDILIKVFSYHVPCM